MPAQILFDAAGQIGQLPVTEQRPGGVTYSLDEIPVVADHHQGARPAVQQVLHLLQRFDIQVIGGLVEQQHVRFGHEHARQLQPAAFATGEVSDRGALARGAEPEHLGDLRSRELLVSQGDSQGDGFNRIEHPDVLRQVVQFLA
ncbi:30S ribosomal protein S5 [Mycobacteroides abscessus subsp. abscessus]|nr:30S ribosomal protein S5 [Mycobacteroides abscessus subsp. abscessus]